MVKEMPNLDVDDSATGISKMDKKYPNRKALDDTFMDQVSLHHSHGAILPMQGSAENGVHGQCASPPTTPYYRLTEEDKRLVQQLRHRLKDQLPPSYDTDFNLYRWLKSVDRSSRQRGNIDLAYRLLFNHLRFRKALKLDESKVPSWDENPAFVKRFLPRGYLHYMPSNNKFLWWVNYSTIDVSGILNVIPTADMLVWHFWLFEHMLKEVNECERRTGAMSGVHMVMDVKDYDMNPFSLMIASNGVMAYYAQLLQYEHYPEVCCPINVINVARWLMLPIRLIRAIMPKDFSERIRVSDCNYQQSLLQEISLDELPIPLGGKNPRSGELRTIEADKLDTNQYCTRRQHENDPRLDQLTHIQVPARKRKLVPIDCPAGAKLKWWFRCDADVYFGIFFRDQRMTGREVAKEFNKDMLEAMEMVYPYFRSLTKLVPERGELECQRAGTYVLVFCNKASWVYKRNVQLKMDIDESPFDRKSLLERAYSVN